MSFEALDSPPVRIAPLSPELFIFLSLIPIPILCLRLALLPQSFRCKIKRIW